jgi:hypothetical protein
MQRKNPNFLFMDSVSHRSILGSFPRVMLSDQSSAFETDYQGNVRTTNGVETSVTLTDVSTPFRLEQSKPTKQSVSVNHRIAKLNHDLEVSSRCHLTCHPEPSCRVKVAKDSDSQALPGEGSRS